MWAKGARGILCGFAGEAGDLGCGRVQYIDVGAESVGIFAIRGWTGAGEVHERVPEAAAAEEALARCVSAAEAESMARGGGLQHGVRG